MESNITMELSPLNLEYLKNQTLKQPAASNIRGTNTLEKTPDGDVFTPQEQNKKSELLSGKQKILIAAGAAAAACVGIYAIVKHKQTSEVKKLIQNNYNSLVEKTAEDMNKAGFAYEKPELVFKKMDKKAMAAYLPNENTINFNTRYLNKNKFSSGNLDAIQSYEIGENLKQFNLFPLKKNFMKQFTEKSMSQAEFQMMNSTTVVHELEHSKQWQAAMHAENFTDLYAQAVKKNNPGATIEQTKKMLADSPFISKFKPSKTISPDTKINFAFNFKKDKNKIGIVFTPKQAVDYFTNYSAKGDKEYYLNPIEIGARLAEWAHAARGDFKGVNDEMKKAFQTIKNTNYLQLVQNYYNKT